ncbi:trafficking protein particle complex subunit 2-like protein isoform X2 [Marmota monax]|uniref:trafficking protein particle complex subunit 2-like protein isoform X2 n=1 Tax=Marmota monax TaxID=9995 RepID=UPI001EAF91DD|nr:trafficking protein particle complex subunit 2-like protein isoform X2 [Marmota monax]
MAVCIAVIAKENYPLYIRSTPMESELKFHYMVHTSLDVVDEKISTMGKALVDQRELYLGLLYPTEDYKDKAETSEFRESPSGGNAACVHQHWPGSRVLHYDVTSGAEVGDSPYLFAVGFLGPVLLYKEG